MSNHWAKARQPRLQTVMFSPTLDAMIAQDHAIRQLDEVLAVMDWSEWEDCYHGYHGQPPVHPRLIAGTILYGLIIGVRSSRKLEDATRSRIDLMWYLESRTLDHATIAKFRKRFGTELKTLFRQLNKEALRLSMSKLVELAADGTRMRASSAMGGARTAESLEKYLSAIDIKFAEILQEMAGEDIAADPKLGSREELQKELKRLESKRKQYKKALKAANQRDTLRRQKRGASEKPVKVPVADPDAHVLPNKEGGFAPNYTPTVVVDKDSRLIIDEDVVSGHAEASCIMPAVSEVEQEYGATPARMSFDGNLASGSNLADLSTKKIKSYSTGGNGPADIVKREDLSMPLAEEFWEELPCRGKNRKLDRSAFVYDGQSYWCPMGKSLGVEKTRIRRSRQHGNISETVYKCSDCGGCPLAQRCLAGKAKYRSVIRDEYETYREALAERMKSEEAKEVYRRRAPLAETIFGYVKGSLGFRQFLTRGLDNVRTEWRWICTAHNLRVLLKLKYASG